MHQQTSPQDIAIIGMSGRFPEARDLDEFYRNLRTGRDSVRPLTLNRIWDTSVVPGREYKQIAFLENIDKFDSQFFKLLESEAACMAPQHRLMLEMAYETIESSGYSTNSLSGTKTAVFIASNIPDYYKLGDEFNTAMLTGNIPSCISGGIARYFNLTGNAVQVDTACSSSLVALHLACQDIISGNADLAICGGINVYVFPPIEGTDSQTGITSLSGRCLTFSDKANGAGMGEGGACLLLKPLHQAKADRDNIIAVIKSTATNQDANRSSTLTAPSSVAQCEVISLAIEKAGIRPESISYIEAHGTGTSLGDPIEIEGLKLAFEKYTDKKQFCAISALKSNIGHTDAAAGILGVIKVLLAINKKELFPSIHINGVNPYIDFIDSPLFLSRQNRYWETPTEKRIAGISSFGISGTNCHVIIEEHEGEKENEYNSDSLLFSLSAHHPESLKNNCLSLSKYVKNNHSISLDRISYSLDTGRENFDYRIAIVAASRDELCKQLEEITIPAEAYNPVPELWFLFSESSLECLEYIRNLAAVFPSYGKAYWECQETLSDLDSATLNTLSFGYAFGAFLTTLGLNVKQVMGLGSGKMLVPLLLKSISLAELRDSSININYTTPKWSQFIAEKLKGNCSIVCEIGAGSNYYRELNILKGSDDNFVACNPTGKGTIADILNFIGHLWKSGYSINFEALFARKPVKTILPTYNFNRKHCWIEDADQNILSSWISQENWSLIQDPELIPNVKNATVYIIYGNMGGLGDAMADKIRTNQHQYILALPNDTQTNTSDACFFNWSDEDAFPYFIEKYVKNDTRSYCHIFIGDLDSNEESIDEAYKNTLYSLLRLVRSLSTNKNSNQLNIITNSAVQVSGFEKHINALFASMHGFAAGIRTEIPELNTRCVDIDLSENSEQLAAQILKILTIGISHLITGLRHGRQYEKKTTVPVKRKPISLNAKGVYIVTGGGSGIGLEVLKWISHSGGTFVVIGRKEFPNKKFWPFVTQDSHPTAYQTIEGFLKAEKAGAKVIYYSADISDARKMEIIVKKIRIRYGRINGVIHSAGIGGKLRIQRHTVESFRETLLPKVHGAYVLNRLTLKDQLDFFIVFSSPNAYASAERESNYSAANSFLDSFSQKLNRENITSITIRWLFWKETGMGYRMNPYQNANLPDEFTLSNSEGVAIFDHILKSGYPEVTINKNAGRRISLDNNSNYKEEIIETETDLKNILLRIWKKSLSREKLSGDDNFFQMGGHSLLGLQIRNQIEKHTGIKLEYRDIAEYPTVNLLYSRLVTFDKNLFFNPKKLNKAPLLIRYPASEAQKSLWIASQTADNKLSYNINFGCKVQGKINFEVLMLSINSLMERQEILRTQFIVENDKIYQEIIPVPECKIPVDIYYRCTETEVVEIKEKMQTHVFELDKAALFKCFVIDLETDEGILLFAFHHIIVDGISVHIFLKELFLTYFKNLQGESPKLPDINYQYKDFSNWEQQQLSGDKFTKHRNFWIKYLEEFPSYLKLPADYQRRPVKSGNGGAFRFELSESHLNGLRRISEQEQVSKFVIGISLLQLLLYRYTGQEDFFIGITSTLRNQKEFEEVMGYFINMLPVRCKISPMDNFYSLLHKCDRVLKDIHEHQLYPLNNIIKDSSIHHPPGHHYFFDIVFTYDHLLEDEHLKSKDVIIDEVLFEEKSSRYDIEFLLKEVGNHLEGILVYDKGLFKEKTISLIAEHFTRLIDTITLNLTVDNFILESEIDERPLRQAKKIEFNF